MKWFERCKDKEIKDGDNNTKYYHAKTNGRKRKNKIFSLIQEGVVEGDDSLIVYIANFYKKTVWSTSSFNCELGHTKCTWDQW